MKEKKWNLIKIFQIFPLPTSARYISATMLYTITKKEKEENFIQGVYSFPTLDNLYGMQKKI